MEISKSISFISEDPRWQQKLLTGTGVMVASAILSFVLIGVLGFLIVAGYTVRLLQNVRDGQPYPLPEWDQWGEDFARGLKLFVVALSWGLPALVLAIPSIVGNALASSNSDAAAAFGAILVICGSCLSILYGLFLAVIQPGYTIAFAQDEQINSGIRLREIWTWTQANIGQVVVVALVYIAASIAISLVAGIVGALLCLVGLIVTIPLGALATALIQYHMYGQLAYAFPMWGSSGGSDDNSGGFGLAAATGAGVAAAAGAGATYVAGSYDTTAADDFTTDFPDTPAASDSGSSDSGSSDSGSSDSGSSDSGSTSSDNN